MLQTPAREILFCICPYLPILFVGPPNFCIALEQLKVSPKFSPGNHIIVVFSRVKYRREILAESALPRRQIDPPADLCFLIGWLAHHNGWLADLNG